MNKDKSTKKLRYAGWWWGKYVQWEGTRWVDEKGQTFPISQVNIRDMEEYVEAKHAHNSVTASQSLEGLDPAIDQDKDKGYDSGL